MRILLLGAPGSGKGTQGAILSRHFDVPHVSSGELLRAQMTAETELGIKVDHYVRRGELVPDDLMVAVVWEAVLDAVGHGGYILDGFPRTIQQAERAYERAKPLGLTADAAVHLVVPDDTVRVRLANRREGRPDDGDADVVERRLQRYHEETRPLLDFYSGRGILFDVDAARPPQEVSTAVLDALRVAHDGR